MASPDCVSFNGVKKSYPPGEKLEVSYTFQEDFTSASRDWVGLFRVGWSSSRDYYTFEWSPVPNEKKGSVVFAGRRLPPEDKHFYQFCYVSSDGRVRGASAPFQFTSAAVGDRSEDLELVEISEDSLMVIQPKEVVQITEPPKPNLEEELVSIKESFTQLEAEKAVLASKYEEDCAKSCEEKEELKAKVMDLERQLQAKRESETRLMEKLEKERALVHQLTAAKTEEEAHTQDFQQQVVELKATLSAVQEASNKQVAELKAHTQELEQRNQGLCGEIEQAAGELDQLREVQVQLMSQIGEKNREIQEVMSKVNEMADQLAEEEQKHKEERDQLTQELSFAQENIAELLGAKKAGVEIIVPTNQDPPTLPNTHVAMVDRSAYEALQAAYENIEEMYHKCGEENRALKMQINTGVSHDACKRKVAELTHRIEQCRVEYTAKCVELHKQGGNAAEVAKLQNRVTEMEENHDQITKSLDSALQELASRREEMKQKEIALEEAMEKFRQVSAEFRDFQDKHDRVVNEKRAQLDQHEDTIGAQIAEITELKKENTKKEHTLQQLREQLHSLKQQAKSTDRACPVCSTKFPGRISQTDFERHVQGHFH